MEERYGTGRRYRRLGLEGAEEEVTSSRIARNRIGGDYQAQWW
jgi:hypothetical protein